MFISKEFAISLSICRLNNRTMLYSSILCYRARKDNRRKCRSAQGEGSDYVLSQKILMMIGTQYPKTCLSWERLASQTVMAREPRNREQCS